MVKGINPYVQGPYVALGSDNILAHQVDQRWQETTTPYGPVFLLLSKGIVELTGNHLILGVLVQRFVELVGIGLIIWAVRRLAIRYGIDPVGALWLGALNPLVLFHLIGGGHNEALMIGLMLAGFEFSMKVTDSGQLVKRLRVMNENARAVIGTISITCAIGIKVTAIVALPFLVLGLAEERPGWRGRRIWKPIILVSCTTLTAFVLATALAGSGWGWIGALSAPGSVQSFLSFSTTLGVAAGLVGVLLGLGDHSQSTVSIMQFVGTAAGIISVMIVIWKCWRGIINPLKGLGVAMGAFVLLGPVIQPWYLLWAVVPLAASTAWSVLRRVVIWVSAIFAVIIMPNGSTIERIIITQAAGIALLVVGVSFYRLYRRGLPQHTPTSEDA